MKTEIITAIKTQFEGVILTHTTYAGEDTFLVPTAQLVAFATALKETYNFDGLIDMTAVDRFTEEERFEVSYNVVSFSKGMRLRFKTRVEEENPHVPTVTHLWGAAHWLEREAFDMMGIIFDGNPDLRRMFLPEDFAYYPLRKEFPLIGVPGSIPLPTIDPPKEYK